MSNPKLTQERLKEMLHYDPDTGVFSWLKKPAKKIVVGSRAGIARHARGYRSVGLFGERHQEHRLAFLYMTGMWPDDGVDHINGIAGDNRMCNLRLCTHAENHQNRPATDTTGTAWSACSRRWAARIKVQGVTIHIGMFDSRQEAHQAYLAAKARLHTFQPTPRDA